MLCLPNFLIGEKEEAVTHSLHSSWPGCLYTHKKCTGPSFDYNTLSINCFNWGRNVYSLEINWRTAAAAFSVVFREELLLDCLFLLRKAFLLLCVRPGISHGSESKGQESSVLLLIYVFLESPHMLSNTRVLRRYPAPPILKQIREKLSVEMMFAQTFTLFQHLLIHVPSCWKYPGSL